jgi:hypothetical protein
MISRAHYFTHPFRHSPATLGGRYACKILRVIGAQP